MCLVSGAREAILTDALWSVSYISDGANNYIQSVLDALAAQWGYGSRLDAKITEPRTLEFATGCLEGTAFLEPLQRATQRSLRIVALLTHEAPLGFAAMFCVSFFV